jgi:hypothetical protein
VGNDPEETEEGLSMGKKDDDDDVSENGYDPGDEASDKEAEDFVFEEWMKDEE